MSFAAPLWLLVGALGLIILVLHMRRRRQLDVSSVIPWRLVENSATPRRKLRWPPASLLLFLQILTVALVALALAEPLFGGRDADTDHTIYVVDASASMRATDEQPSRFDAAIAWLTGQVDTATNDADGRVSIVTAGAEPQIAVARQAAGPGIVPILADMRAVDAPADWNATAALLRDLVRADEATRIFILSDGTETGVPNLPELFPGAEVEDIQFAAAGTDNTGVTATIVPVAAENNEWRLVGTVAFGAAVPQPVTLVVRFQPDGTDGFVDWAEIPVTPPAPETPEGGVAAPRAALLVPFDFALTLPGAGALSIALPDDAGPYDNSVNLAVLPAPVQLHVLYIGDNPSLELTAAIQAIGNVQLTAANGLPEDDELYDLVIVDGFTVGRRPETNVLWIGAAHVAGETEPAQLRNVAATGITGWDDEHFLSERVDWTAISPQVAYRFSRLPGATVLAESAGAALVQARTRITGREVRIAFELANSGWFELPDFPVFVSNLINWLGVDAGATIAASCVAGAPCPIEAKLLLGRVTGPDGAEVWTAGEAPGADYFMPGVERTFVPERAGFYRIEATGGARLIPVNADITGETLLEPVNLIDEALPAANGPSRLWWWLLAAAFVVLLAETWLAGRGAEQFLKRPALANSNPLFLRRRLQLGVRIASLVFLVLALAGLPILTREPAEDVVVVTAGNLGPGDRNVARDRLLQQVEEAVGAGERGGLVATGDANQIATDLGGTATAPLTMGAQGVNLEEAVRLAAAMIPGDRSGRIVIATDGNETAGEVAQAVAALQARGLTVDIQPLNELPTGEVLVESLNAPAQVYTGDTFRLDAVIYSQGATSATVTVTRAGETILEQNIDLLAGRNRIDAVLPAGEAGNLLLEVAVVAAGDTYAENNINGALVEVMSVPSILVITPEPALGDYFAQALTVQGLTAEVVLPEAVAEWDIDDWLGHEGVVMMNVPAIDLPTEQQELLEEYVQVHGRGLLLLGGENTFGPGGYYQTPFERMSPISSRVPHELPQVAIVYVLDRSGSMSAAVSSGGGVTRLDLAKEATLNAVGLLSPTSRVGIIVFDSDAYIIVPLQDALDAAAVQTALDPLVPGGGTNIYPGLESAIAMLAGIDAETKHIVVMTDGLTTRADFLPLLDAANDAGITISTIGIGIGAEDRLLVEIAAIGGGQFHLTPDVRALPSILSQETLMLAGSPFREEVAQVAWADRSPEFLAGLPDVMPPVYSYVVTTLKPQADLHMTVTTGDGEVMPLMASWRYGNGHVLAFTTHGAGAGTAEWIQMPEYPLLWAQIIRSFLPDTPAPGLHARAERAGDMVAVIADVLAADGTPLTGRVVTANLTDTLQPPIALREVSPGRYEGAFTAGEPGPYHVAVTADDLADEAMVYVAYPARFDFGRADLDKLQALAAATGGQLLLGNEPVFTGETQWVTAPGWRIWALIAMLLFILDLTIRHAPSLFGLRKTRPLGRGIPVPA